MLIPVLWQVQIEAQERRSHGTGKWDLEVVCEELQRPALANGDGEVEPGVIIANEVRERGIPALILLATDDAVGIPEELALAELVGDHGRWLGEDMDELKDLGGRRPQ